MKKIIILICSIFILCSCSNKEIEPIHDSISFENVNIKEYTDNVTSIKIANDSQEVKDISAINYAISIVNSYKYIPYPEYFDLFYNSDFYYLMNYHEISRYNIEFISMETDKFYLIFNTADNNVIIYLEYNNKFTILMSTEKYTAEEFNNFKEYDFGLGYTI